MDFLALSWLGNRTTSLWILVAVVLWSVSGLGVITYLAGMATISEDIFDAAAIDGSNFLNTFFKIVIPLMLPIIGYWTILCTGGMFLWMFPFIETLTGGGPGYSSMLPEYLIYITAFKYFERGYGTAIGISLFFFVVIFSLLQIRYIYIGTKSRRQIE